MRQRLRLTVQFNFNACLFSRIHEIIIVDIFAELYLCITPNDGF